MPELEIQKYLRSGKIIDQLSTDFAIKTKRHSQYPNLVLFKYNQIESPFAERIVQECRGIILDESDNWKVVSRAFDKFFNYGEGHAAKIDWSTAKVQEKADGSLCSLFWYKNKWHVATTGTPDASGNINLTGIKFSDLFWKTYNSYAQDVFYEPNENCRKYCFFFELTSPYNRIVVRHQKSDLTLLGARQLESGEEITPSDASCILKTDIPSIREFKLSGIDDIISSFDKIDPLNQEGYVVVDGNFNRIKVKHPGYVALHHAIDGLSTKSFVEIARSGEISEVVVAFPELKKDLDEAKAKINELIDGLERVYEENRHIESQKEFALKIAKIRCNSALFQLRSGKVNSVREFIKQMNIEQLMKILGYKE